MGPHLIVHNEPNGPFGDPKRLCQCPQAPSTLPMGIQQTNGGDIARREFGRGPLVPVRMVGAALQTPGSGGVLGIGARRAQKEMQRIDTRTIMAPMTAKQAVWDGAALMEFPGKPMGHLIAAPVRSPILAITTGRGTAPWPATIGTQRSMVTAVDLRKKAPDIDCKWSLSCRIRTFYRAEYRFTYA